MTEEKRDHRAEIYPQKYPKTYPVGKEDARLCEKEREGIGSSQENPENPGEVITRISKIGKITA